MANERQALTRTVAVVLLLGAVFAAIPFCSSLQPNANAGASIPRLSVASLEPGSFRLDRMSDQFAFLLLKDHDSSLHLFWLRVGFDGNIVMPQYHVWDGPSCTDFGPDVNGGRIIPGGAIRCHDPGQDKWHSSLHWAYSGRRLGAGCCDLSAVRFRVEGGDIVPWMPPESSDGA
jgi:hypothetical protein